MPALMAMKYLTLDFQSVLAQHCWTPYLPERVGSAFISGVRVQRRSVCGRVAPSTWQACVVKRSLIKLNAQDLAEHSCPKHTWKSLNVRDDQTRPSCAFTVSE